jgi:hypothetical protein
MAVLSNRKNIKKIINETTLEGIEKLTIQIFSSKFFEKVIKHAINFFNIKEFRRTIGYVSENGGHSFLTIIFPRNKIIPPSDINLFRRDIRKVLSKVGYTGKVDLVKQQKLIGKTRKAVETPLVWKSKTCGGCWVLFFERYA